MIRIFALAAALMLPLCGTTAGTRAIEVPVALGRTAYVGGLRVRLERVVEDSRCPMNARCVWAGRVVVRAAVTTGAGTRRMDLTLGNPARVADGTLTLVSVTPDRVAGERLDAKRYRFGFEFAGGF